MDFCSTNSSKIKDTGAAGNGFPIRLINLPPPIQPHGSPPLSNQVDGGQRFELMKAVEEKMRVEWVGGWVESKMDGEGWMYDESKKRGEEGLVGWCR
ncbi:hypothetical protein ACFX13_019657 [Malus domestica]